MLIALIETKVSAGKLAVYCCHQSNESLEYVKVHENHTLSYLNDSSLLLTKLLGLFEGLTLYLLV